MKPTTHNSSARPQQYIGLADNLDFHAYLLFER
jgi:hypothetical protein